MASNLLAMASNLLAMASDLIASKVILSIFRSMHLTSLGCPFWEQEGCHANDRRTAMTEVCSHDESGVRYPEFRRVFAFFGFN